MIDRPSNLAARMAGASLGLSSVMRWPTRAAAVCTVLLLSGPALAGGAGLGTPMPGNLTASAITGKVGSKLEVALDFVPDREFDVLWIRFVTNGCAQIAAADATQTRRALAAGRQVTAKAKLTIKRPGPCLISARVAETDDPGMRVGSVFGVTLNPAAADETAQLKGKTSDGQATVDAVVGSRPAAKAAEGFPNCRPWRRSSTPNPFPLGGCTHRMDPCQHVKPRRVALPGFWAMECGGHASS